MITITDVKNKYKQLKYQHLKKIYEKNLTKLPTNCKYNKQIKLHNSSRINICTFNLEDSYEVDLCYKPEHSKPCNAFCHKKTKEQLYEEMLKDIGDDKERATKYKDINMLFWLYPDLKDEEFPENIKTSIIAKPSYNPKSFFLKFLVSPITKIFLKLKSQVISYFK